MGNFAAIRALGGEAGIVTAARWAFAGFRPDRSVGNARERGAGSRQNGGEDRFLSLLVEEGAAPKGRSENWRPPPSARPARSSAAARTSPRSPVVEADFAIGPPKPAVLEAKVYPAVVGSARRGNLTGTALLARLGADRPIGSAERRGQKRR